MFEDFRCVYFRFLVLRAEIYIYCILFLLDWNFLFKFYLLGIWNFENIFFDKILIVFKLFIFKESEREEIYWRYEGEILFWEIEFLGKLGCFVKMNLLVFYNVIFVNIMYCLFCFFIFCFWEEIWYCVCFLSDFKIFIYYLFLIVLFIIFWFVIFKYYFMLVFFFYNNF